MCVYICVCVVPAHVCTYMWKPEDKLPGIFPQELSTLFAETGSPNDYLGLLIG